MKRYCRSLAVVSALCATAAPLAATSVLASPSSSTGQVSVMGLERPTHAWVISPASGPIHGVPIRNFGCVSPGCLYRSAEPGSESYEWLAKHGFRGVVCLRAEHDCSDLGTNLKGKGISYLRLPIKNEHAPTDEQAVEFLKFVQDSSHWPILVHCADGVGRASTMSALVRYSIDGWSMSDALAEAKRYRPFHFKMFGEQRRWLNHWKDRFAAGDYAPKPNTAAVDTGKIGG